MEEINNYLQGLAAKLNQQRIDEEYEDMMNMLLAEHNTLLYAAYSYDNE